MPPASSPHLPQRKECLRGGLNKSFKCIEQLARRALNDPSRAYFLVGGARLRVSLLNVAQRATDASAVSLAATSAPPSRGSPCEKCTRTGASRDSDARSHSRYAARSRRPSQTNVRPR